MNYCRWGHTGVEIAARKRNKVKRGMCWKNTTLYRRVNMQGVRHARVIQG